MKKREKWEEEEKKTERRNRATAQGAACRRAGPNGTSVTAPLRGEWGIKKTRDEKKIRVPSQPFRIPVLIASHLESTFLRSGSRQPPSFCFSGWSTLRTPGIQGEREIDDSFFSSSYRSASRRFFQIATRPRWKTLPPPGAWNFASCVLLVTSCSKKQSSWKYFDAAKLLSFSDRHVFFRCVIQAHSILKLFPNHNAANFDV